MKYSVMLQFQMKEESAKERSRLRARISIFKQITLFPITGGLSFWKVIRGWIRGD